MFFLLSQINNPYRPIRLLVINLNNKGKIMVALKIVENTK
jgi:hypothetical protein